MFDSDNRQSNTLQELKCKACHTLNAPKNLFCCGCGAGLNPHLSILTQSAIRAQLPDALKLHLKDAALVEMEIAERALDRVIKWAKYSALVLSAPVAVLGILGIKGFMDVSATYEKLSKQLTDLEQRTRSVANQVDLAGNKAETLGRAGTKISIAYQDLEKKLGEYQQFSAKLTALQKKVTDLETRIPPPRVDQFDKAVDIMARTIFGEARSIGRDGMEAVAAVIANRVNSSANADLAWFGRTVEEVCLKRFQFSSWYEGNPNFAIIKNIDSTDPMFIEALKIARQTILGELIDRTGGATYYHVAALPSLPRWVQTVKPTLQIGPYKFYRGFADGEKR